MASKTYRVKSPSSGKSVVVARMGDDKVLRKDVKGSVHKLNRLQAWATDDALIETAVRDGAVAYCIRDLESAERFWIYMDDYLSEKTRVPYKTGAGQSYVPITKWVKTKDDYCPLPRRKPVDTSSQLALVF